MYLHSIQNGLCPLLLACDRGRIDTVRLLIGRGADVNILGEVMLIAIGTGRRNQ